MIISGGVNIYPREIEDAFVMHPKVRDVAVFGVPNEEMGEEVKAVVEPAGDVEPSPALAVELPMSIPPNNYVGCWKRRRFCKWGTARGVPHDLFRIMSRGARSPLFSGAVREAAAT